MEASLASAGAAREAAERAVQEEREGFERELEVAGQALREAKVLGRARARAVEEVASQAAAEREVEAGEGRAAEMGALRAELEAAHAATLARVKVRVCVCVPGTLGCGLLQVVGMWVNPLHTDCVR
jgi:hypothetical protein